MSPGSRGQTTDKQSAQQLMDLQDGSPGVIGIVGFPQGLIKPWHFKMVNVACMMVQAAGISRQTSSLTLRITDELYFKILSVKNNCT